MSATASRGALQPLKVTRRRALQLMGGVNRDATLFDAAVCVLATFQRKDLIGSLEA